MRNNKFWFVSDVTLLQSGCVRSHEQIKGVFFGEVQQIFFFLRRVLSPCVVLLSGPAADGRHQQVSVTGGTGGFNTV